MKNHQKAILLLFAASLATPAFSALPPLSDEARDRAAEFILEGDVTRVVNTTDGPWGDSDFIDNVHTVTIRVTSVAKGEEKITSGGEISVRCTTPNYRPPGWAGPAGHATIPRDGDRCRMWLRTREDGMLTPLEPNGVEILPVRDAGGEATEDTRHPIDVAMQRAMDANPSTAGQTGAMDRALEQWDDELNRNYQKLIRGLDSAAADRLRASQRQWISFRDLEIANIRSFHSQLKGTMFVPMQAHSELTLTRDRALALAKLARLMDMRE